MYFAFSWVIPSFASITPQEMLIPYLNLNFSNLHKANDADLCSLSNRDE